MTAQEQFQSDRATSNQYNSYRRGETTSAPALARAPIGRASALAATINVGQGAPVQSLISAANPGDTVIFNDVSINAPLNFKNGVNYAGSLTVTTDTKSFAIKLPNPAQNINVNLKLRCNCGGIIAPGPMADCSFDGDYQWGGNGTYYNRIAIRSTSSNTRCSFKGRYANSPNSDRTFDLYNTTDCTFDVEQYDINDGGHIDGSHHNLHIKRWQVAKVRRMGLELQDQGGSGDGILIENYSVDGHVRPYNESFGISLMPQRHKNVRLVKPYVRAGTEAITAGSHKGYGIEIGADAEGSSVTGAIVIGDYVAGFACAMKVPISGSRVYGSQQWGAFSGEPGLNGGGTFVDAGDNQKNLPIDKAPNPGTTQDTPMLGIKITGTDPNNLSIVFTDVPAGATKPTVKVTTDKGEQIGPLVSLPDTSAVLTGLPGGWHLILTPMVAGVVGTPSAAFKTDGASAAYPAALSMQVTVKTGSGQTPPDGKLDYDLIVPVRGGLADFTKAKQVAAAKL